jgi:hypothetical protein
VCAEFTDDAAVARRYEHAADEIERLLAERRAFNLVLPAVGSVWWWEPEKPHARALVQVDEVEFNGEEWVVWCSDPNDKSAEWYWNELSRWVEATVLHSAATPQEDDRG